MSEAKVNDMPVEKATFQARYEGETKIGVLEYQNKDWLDVVRTAIAENKESDDENEEEKKSTNMTSATSPKVPTKSRSRSNSSSSSSSINAKQNFGGVSFKDARELVRDKFSIYSGSDIKFFNPKTMVEVRAKKDFTVALEEWEDTALEREQAYYVTACKEILVHLAAYCQTKTSNTVVTAVAEDIAPTAAVIDDDDVHAPDHEMLPSEVVGWVDTSEHAHRRGSTVHQIVHKESHEIVFQGMLKLKHCCNVMKENSKQSKQFMKLKDWELFLRRCWHHLIRACRSSDYQVATEASNLLSSQEEFILLGKENRLAPMGHVQQGSAFLCLLINHGGSNHASQHPERLAGCLTGLIQCNFHSAEEFFHEARPHNSGDVTSPLISLLGTSISSDAAAMLASVLRLATPQAIGGVIDEMISRPEIESYSLGLKLVITMSTSEEGRNSLWTRVGLFDHATEIGIKVFNYKDKQHFATLRLVAHALLTHLMSAPTRGPSFVDTDQRRESYTNSMPLLLKLISLEDNHTASYACGALALLANANLVHYDASEDLLKLIELPAPLGVTEQAAISLCNIAHWNPSQSEKDTLLFMSRCAKTLAIRARNKCEHAVQKYLARTMLFCSNEYASSHSQHLEKNQLSKAAAALLKPLGTQELLFGYPGAIEDVIRCIWNIGTKDRDLLQPLISAGAIGIMVNILNHSMPSVTKQHRRRKNRRHRKRSNHTHSSSSSSSSPSPASPSSSSSLSKHQYSQNERFLISTLGVLFVLSTQETDPIQALDHLTWLFPLTFKFIDIEGPSRTLIITLLHSVLATCRLSPDQKILEPWSCNNEMIEHLLDIAHGKHASSNTFTRLQAVAVMEHLDVPATATNKNGTTYIDTMCSMLRSRDFFACGSAAGLLSRWALIPSFKQVLLQEQCGKHAVQIVLRANKVIENIETNSGSDFNGKKIETKQHAIVIGVLPALIAAIRALRNLVVHKSFQPSVGKYGIEALSRTLAPLQAYNCMDAMKDAQTALYCLGRNPINIRRSYKIHLQMQSERLKFEEEASIRIALDNKAKRSLSVRRQIYQSGAGSIITSPVRKKGRKQIRPKSGGMWERKRRAMSSNHWIASPLSAKHVISADDDVNKVVPLSTRLCRPTALLLSAGLDPEHARFRYQDHWRPKIKSLEYKPIKKSRGYSSKEDDELLIEVQKKVTQAVMNAQTYILPRPSKKLGKRPGTAPSGRRNIKNKKKKNRPKTASPGSRKQRRGQQGQQGQQGLQGQSGQKLENDRHGNSRSVSSIPRKTRPATGTRSRSRSSDRIMKSPSSATPQEENDVDDSDSDETKDGRPKTAPLKSNKKNRSRKQRPATANPLRKKETFTEPSKVYNNLEFSLLLNRSSRVNFKSKSMPSLDTKTNEIEFKKEYEGVKCCRFDAIPDTSTAADADIPTYELPDGRFTHYYVKTDLQPPGKGIEREPAPQICTISKIFPGIHSSTELAKQVVSLDPNLDVLKYLGSTANNNSSRRNSGSNSNTNSQSLTTTSNEHSENKDEKDINQHENDQKSNSTLYAYKPNPILFDILLKTTGKKMSKYKPPNLTTPIWNIYDSMYNYRVQDPLSKSVGNDSLAIETLSSNDFDLVSAIHEDVLLINGKSMMNTRSKQELKCVVLRHSSYLFEAYLIFRAGCTSMFGKDQKSENIFRKLCPRPDIERHLFLAGIIKTITMLAKNSENMLTSCNIQINQLEKTISHIATHAHIDFRWRYLYNSETMSTLSKHDIILHTIFMFFCDTELEEITLKQWIGFCSILQIELSNFYISLLFKWSCSLGQTTLQFADFVECLCRLCLLVPLPSEIECKDVQQKSAFIYLENERISGRIREWEKKNYIHWTHTPSQSISDVLPRFIDYVDRKLRVARNIQHFLSKKWNKWQDKIIENI